MSTNLILSQSTAMHFLGQADDEADAVNLTVSGWKHRGDVSLPGCGCDARWGWVCSNRKLSIIYCMASCTIA